ncbi:YqaJ viral recombinase family protein [Streptacidiphilus sp. N1-12]|uniref:YqaJ viral recombinase family protein n=2 Tax=Streptacidiphilus alkalitolerans TaxID=3342712 RepID=A0ABV6WEB8_9ACTN
MTTATMLPSAVGDLVTPTARLVLPAGTDRSEWLAARRFGIGASDVAAILDLADFGTPRAVFLDKLGQLQDSAGDAAHWGNVMEGPIAKEWERRNRSVVEDIGLVAHAEDPVMLTTLDRRVVECPLPETRHQVCALEIKCRSAFKGGRWHDGAPDDVLAQLLWQLAVTGLDHVHYAVLVGGNDYRQGVVRAAAHQATMQDIVSGCRAWWDRHVVPGVLPPASDNAARELEMYKRLHPNGVGIVRLDDDPDVLTLLRNYETARLAEKAAEQQKDAAQVELRRLLGDAQFAYLDNQLAYAANPTDGRIRTNYERLAERWPDAYADCVSYGDPGTRFDVDKAYRLKPTKES